MRLVLRCTQCAHEMESSFRVVRYIVAGLASRNLSYPARDTQLGAPLVPYGSEVLSYDLQPLAFGLRLRHDVSGWACLKLTFFRFCVSG